MASISLRHISKLYPGNVKAVDDFSMEIKDKEFVVLVGPSGCGKSTTLRMIAGLEEITEGELYIEDRLVNKVHPKDRNIAMVFQNYALYPHMTVYKNLAFSLELRKFSKKEIDEKVLAAAQTLQIQDLLQRKPKALSGGQRQRVALGRAMVRDPKVFLLDEPLSNLDAKLRTEMRAEISKLHKKLGATFVYVTHDQMEAMSMGDRIVVMKDGIINQIDTPQKLYESPCNSFVASFIGSPQMNMVDVVVKKEKDQYYLDFHGKLLKLNHDKFPYEVMEDYVGATVVMGIRAENLYDHVENIGNSVEMDVEITELMGSEVYAYMNFMGSRFTAKLPSSTKATMSGKIMIELDVNKIHLFNKENGMAIGAPAN